MAMSTSFKVPTSQEIPKQKTRVLFVCLGNICRSPSAQAVCEKLLAEMKLTHRFEVDSAGTLDYHVGEPPDPRAIAFGEKAGLKMSHLRGRQVCQQDFYTYDDILVMDAQNLQDVTAIKPPDATATVAPIMNFACHASVEVVPDPYFGGDAGFTHVLELLFDAIKGYIEARVAE